MLRVSLQELLANTSVCYISIYMYIRHIIQGNLLHMINCREGRPLLRDRLPTELVLSFAEHLTLVVEVIRTRPCDSITDKIESLVLLYHTLTCIHSSTYAPTHLHTDNDNDHLYS